MSKSGSLMLMAIVFALVSVVFRLEGLPWLDGFTFALCGVCGFLAGRAKRKEYNGES